MGPTKRTKAWKKEKFCLGYHLALFEGVVYTAVAVRQLVELGLKPTLHGQLPKPTYLPLTRPPASTKIKLQAI
ncbi:MAG: hypothetical protein EP343_06330 [Deltaproteobacteria bacterium]|nr:MAG: hypothetical protein EP343_06330 [Deltaproteobacteria bacterium]